MSLAEAAIGWLAPPNCLICTQEGANLCLACQQAEITAYGERCFNCGQLSRQARTCPTCRRGGAPSHVWVATDYAGAAQALVTAYKFGHGRACSNEMTELMADTFLLYNPAEAATAKNYLICYVPTASSRVRQRGFDHARRLAWQLADRLKLERADCLARLGQTQQVGASRSARLAQAAASYRVKSPSVVADRRILLIDDVVTTGATLTVAAKQLRQAGAKSVDALVFAKKL